MKNPFSLFWFRIFKFISPSRFPSAVKSEYEPDVIYEDVSKQMSEEELSEICVQNTAERLLSQNIDPASEEAALYLSKDKVGDVEFDKRVKADLDKKPARIKKYAKKRFFNYKLHTTGGVVLFEGTNLRKFMRETKTILPFTYKNAFYHADKHQANKPLRDKYIITSEEIVTVKN